MLQEQKCQPKQEHICLHFSLGSDGIAEVNKEIFKQIQDKHPTTSTYQSFAQSTTKQLLSFTTEQVKKAIKRFKRGSATCPDGQRAEHLVALMGAVDWIPDRLFIKGVSQLVNICATGKVPPDVQKYVAGSRMFGILKKNGSICPKSVGNIIRCLTSVPHQPQGRFKKNNECLVFYETGVGENGVRLKKVKNQTPYDNFYFAETCTDSQTFKSWIC